MKSAAASELALALVRVEQSLLVDKAARVRARSRGIALHSMAFASPGGSTTKRQRLTNPVSVADDVGGEREAGQGVTSPPPIEYLLSDFTQAQLHGEEGNFEEELGML